MISHYFGVQAAHPPKALEILMQKVTLLSKKFPLWLNTLNCTWQNRYKYFIPEQAQFHQHLQLVSSYWNVPLVTVAPEKPSLHFNSMYFYQMRIDIFFLCYF